MATFTNASRPFGDPSANACTARLAPCLTTDPEEPYPTQSRNWDFAHAKFSCWKWQRHRLTYMEGDRHAQPV